MGQKVIFLFVLLFAPLAHAAESRVVVSIKPLHSLVAGVMQGDAEPTLLVKGSASPHLFSMKPSDLQAIKAADVVFYMDDKFELFLPRALQVAPESLERVAMTSTPGIMLYEQRQNGIWTDEHDHAHTRYDMHLWLSPKNAMAMTRYIEAVLAKHYPDKAALYRRNADAQVASLQKLDAELVHELAPVKAKPFVVFHDAYQYFEKTYGLNAQAAMTLSPEQLMSAKHIAALQKVMEEKHVTCAFREPFLESRILQQLVKNTHVKSAELDPEGLRLNPGVNLYFELMRGLAGNMRECLE